MKSQPVEMEAANLRMENIARIRDKIKLLDKCRRKMEMASLDPDSMKLFMVAHEQLTDDIKGLCHRVGL